MYKSEKKKEKIEESFQRLEAIRRLIKKTNDDYEKRIALLTHEASVERRRYKRLST